MRLGMMVVAGALLASGRAWAENVPCQGKVVVQNVVSTNMGNGYHSSTLQLQNTTGKPITATVQFADFPFGFTLKAGGTRQMKADAHGLWSIYFAASQRAMNRGDVTLVFDGAALPAKTITVRVSGCQQ